MSTTQTPSGERPSGGLGAPPKPTAELRVRRERITHALLGGLAVLGAVAYVPSVWAGVTVGVWSVVVLDTVVYAAIVYVFLRPDLGLRVRAAVVVAIAAVLGVALSIMFGPNGAGALWLAAVPVLTALLFDRRATLWSLGFLVVTLAVVAGLRWADLVAWDVTPGGTLLWLIIAGNAIAIAGALALGVSTLIGGLTEAAARTERYGAALAREQTELLEVNDRLERLIHERGRVEARLRETEKLTAIGTLAGGIAHDMNNLLVPIVAGTELLRAGETDEERRAELLDRMLVAVRAARDLVQRILAFSEPAGEARTALDAPTAFRDAARLLEATLPAGIDLAFRSDPDAGAVVLSPGEVHQIVLNLGRNAAQAMPDGGKVAVAVDSLPAVNRPPDVPKPGSGRFVRLMVADGGIGMDEATLSRVFEPFFTTRRESSAEGGGHGIGLATVYGIVTRAGGFIVPHSQPGAGTVMEVFLPQAPAGVTAAEPAEEPTPSGLGRRVLVVDDDETVRLMAIRILESAGYRPVGAESVAAALEQLEGEHRFEAVLTDHAMPGQDGLQLAATLRTMDPRLPVVLMSGRIDSGLRRRARDLAINGLVSKPFGVDDLTVKIAAALRGGRVANGHADEIEGRPSA
jgi:signal transduction histidine kinase/CheY-like chemotaxis protein